LEQDYTWISAGVQNVVLIVRCTLKKRVKHTGTANVLGSHTTAATQQSWTCW
jgi:hypothetical protein